MKKIVRPRPMREAATRQIRDAVVSGEYAPGALISEMALSESLGVSRSTVREALRTLEERGLVTRPQGQRAYVRGLTAEEAWEACTLRARLESFGARIVVEDGRLTPSALTRLQAACEDLERIVDRADRAAAVDADMAFHERVCELSGHQMLIDHLSRLRDHTSRFITLSNFYKADRAMDVSDHWALLDALQSGDADRAEAAFRDHVLQAGQRLRVHLQERRP